MRDKRERICHSYSKYGRICHMRDKFKCIHYKQVFVVRT